MTLAELMNAWWEDDSPVLVSDAKWIDDVFDAIMDGKEITRGFVCFSFIPRWSEWKCSTYLKAKWAHGEVEAFTKLKDGTRLVCVKPKESIDKNDLKLSI